MISHAKVNIDYVSRWKNCLSYIFLFFVHIFELTGSDEKLAKNISWNSRNNFFILLCWEEMFLCTLCYFYYSAIMMVDQLWNNVQPNRKKLVFWWKTEWESWAVDLSFWNWELSVCESRRTDVCHSAFSRVGNAHCSSQWKLHLCVKDWKVPSGTHVFMFLQRIWKLC